MSLRNGTGSRCGRHRRWRRGDRQLKLVDAGDLYLSWRWEHEPAAPRVQIIPRELVQDVLDEWAAAVPSPLPVNPRGRRCGAHSPADR